MPVTANPIENGVCVLKYLFFFSNLEKKTKQKKFLPHKIIDIA